MADAIGLDEIRRALAEDRAFDDVTTRLACGDGCGRAVLRVVAEQRCVVAGTTLIPLVFQELDASTRTELGVADGDWVSQGTTVAAVHGPALALLAGERVALNLLQHLSGVATATRRAVEAVAGTAARITHTRKTTPGLRALELHAVRVGGGVDNRASLADAILWKDNHWALLRQQGRSLADALATVPPHLEVVVEVETDAQLDEAMAAGVGHILVDNQRADVVRAWVRRAGSRVRIQASGGITLDNVRAYAEAGAHLISIGALTHSVTAVAMSCELTSDF